MDRMSGLSDELLIKILTFLPTKDAVSTSVLSKRWEFLWMWLSKLEYSSKYYSKSECKKLQCFLDRNLPLHRAPVLESLRLELCNSLFKAENISLWVVLAISRCLRELEISCSSYPDKPDVLPSNLYICKSLVILKLDGRILLDVPRMVFLPSLKTLQLKNVRYLNDESLQRLLSKCSVLQDLLVELHEDDIMGKFTIIVPSLQSLSLYIPYHYDIDGYEIETPSSKYFKLKDHNNNGHYCMVENMPDLVEAYVDVEFADVESVIRSITSVKRLTICSEVVYEEGFVFNQLEHLKLCRCKANSSNLLVRLLEDSPNLQVLELFEMHDHYHNGTVSWNQPSTVPKCVLSSLQTFKCSIYTGVPEERDLAVYILNNAGQLKTTTISFEENDVPEIEMIKELARSSRASAACQLMFE